MNTETAITTSRPDAVQFGEKLATRLLSGLVCMGVAGMSSWTVIIWLAYGLHMTPAMLQRLLPVLAALLLLALVSGWHFGSRLVRKTGAPPVAEPLFKATVRLPGTIRPAAVLAVLGVALGMALASWRWLDYYQLLWAGLFPLMGLLALRFRLLRERPLPPPLAVLPLELAVVSLLAVSLWLAQATTTFHDSDDAHFVDAAASFTNEPDLPMFRTDTLFEEPDRPNHIYTANLGQAWEALSGYLSAVTGLDLLWLYYTLIPLATYLAFVLLTLLTLKTFGQRFATMGVVASALAMLQFSGGGAMAAAFFSNRIYQGKAALIVVAMPAILLAAYWYAQRPGAARGLFLCVAVIAAAGCSSTGLYQGPIMAGVALLCFMPWTRPGLLHTVLLTIAVSMPNLLALGAFYLLSGTGGAIAESNYGRTRFIADFFARGDAGIAVYYAYFAAALLVYLAKLGTSSPLLPRLMLVLVTLLLCPILPLLLGELTGIVNLYWRYYWLFPIALVVALAAASVTELCVNGLFRLPGPNLRMAGMVMAMLGFLALISQSVWAGKLERWLQGERLYADKVRPEHRSLVDFLADPDNGVSRLVTDERLAQQLAVFPSLPPQLVIRMYYINHIPELSAAERADIRRANELLSSPGLLKEAAGELHTIAERRGVSHVVLRGRRINPSTDRGLRQAGFTCQPVSYYHVCQL